MRRIAPAIFLLITFFCTAAAGQEQRGSRFTHSVNAGLNIGAISPLPLPNTIRKVKSYSPSFSPAVGYEVRYAINKRWAAGIKVQLNFKGMTVKDSVMYFHTLVEMNDGAQSSSFEGSFTGTNFTKARNLYFAVPVYAVFKPVDKWHYKLGGYLGFLLKRQFEGTVSNGYIRNGGPTGEKVQIESASFDFADKQRSFDFGAYGGVSHNINKKWSLNADPQWGLRSVFPSSFTGISFNMYNIFANFGASYVFP